MHDRFEFSNGQDLSTLDSTGVISDNIYDLEYDNADALIKADQMIECWLNVSLLSIASTAANEGMYIKLIESDSANGSTPSYLGVIQLLEAEMVTGNMYCIGVSKQLTKRYLSVWYMAHTNSLDGANTVDAWITEHPMTSPTYRCQKRPA